MRVPPRSHGIRKQRAARSLVTQRVILPSEHLIHDETISGALLFLAALGAIVWANSDWKNYYHAFRDFSISLQFGDFAIQEDVKHWINDGLMAVFFFVVTLEIKREMLYGELSDIRSAALPVTAALGGMVVPVAIFLAFNMGTTAARGWGIPMATDIAFAVAVLALLSKRIPTQLRLFLLAYAIVDDIGSILVIAVFYTGTFLPSAMGIAGLVLGVILMMRWLGFRNLGIYVLPAVVFWAAVLKSGIHATIAGVVLAAVTPSHPSASSRSSLQSYDQLSAQLSDAFQRPGEEQSQIVLGQLEELARETESPAERLERSIGPWVSYFVLPLFALANAGIELSLNMIADAFRHPVTQGIIFGLLPGKAIGVFGFSWIALRLGVATLPPQMTLRHVAGAGFLGGVGFTVSLFISSLAYSEGPLNSEAIIGILAGSSVSAIVGFLFLRLASSTSEACS